MIALWLALGSLIAASLTAVAVRALRAATKHEIDRGAAHLGQATLADDVQQHRNEVSLMADTLVCLLTSLFGLSFGVFLLGHGWLTAGRWPLGILFAVVGMLLALALVVWLPAAFTPHWAAPFLLRTWGVWRLLLNLFAPGLALARGVAWLAKRLWGHTVVQPTEESLEEEIRTIVTEGQREGLLEEEAREMIEGVIELGDVTAGDIMTPRTEMNAMHVAISLVDAATAVVEAGHSRIPVYGRSRDEIVGVLYTKDLLAELLKPEDDRTALSELVRPPVFVPETKPVSDLLEEFQKSRNHMAIVLDEFGGVAGLVTIEDVLEEIVGEIADEHDEAFVDGIRQINDHTSEISARLSIEEFNERLGLQLPDAEDFDTVGGFVFNEIGHLPTPGEQVRWRNLQFTVLGISRRRIETLRLEVLDPAPSEPVGGQ
ncbi:MAG: hemolysin family protein [Pirellulales bacterium]